METFHGADDVYEFLNRFLNFERKLEPVEYRLDRMHTLRRMFGMPDTSFKTIHVAGSKGKGSSSTMLAEIAFQRKPGVGLFTSPHLLHFTERIAIDGQPVHDDILLPSAQELAGGIAGTKPEDFPGGEAPTYFELLTVLAFLCFRRAGCWIAVIETGLGGRLDATNVITPIASVITPIELEHTDILGDTIELIAAEKGGIIKSGIPVFVNSGRPEAIGVLRKIAIERESDFHLLSDEVSMLDIEISAHGTSFKAVFPHHAAACGELKFLTPLIGRVQAQNAALAGLTALSLGYSIEEIRAGLARSRLRARFEIIRGKPLVVLDGAHTPDSVRACVEDFSAIFPAGGILLFGCAKDKKTELMAKELRKKFCNIIITKPGTFKESDTTEIERVFTAQGFSVERIDDTPLAVKRAAQVARAADLPLLVCGSFYLCAELAAALPFRRA